MSTYNQVSPQPTPLCEHFKPLLALRGTDALSLKETTSLNEHIANCAWCQREVIIYDALNAAARRQFAGVRVPPITLEEIMRESETESTRVTGAPRKGPSGAAGRSRLSALGAVAAVLVVAALAGLIFSTRGTGAPGVEPTEFTAPTATATLSLANTQVIFANSAPWGKLTVNGKQQETDKPATLLRGQNTLTYEAAPYPTIDCTISAPTSASDTCPLTPVSPTSSFQGRIVDLGATLQRLSTKDYDALVAATQNVLDGVTSTTVVMPGDHYIDASGHVATSGQSISATLTFALPTTYVIYAGLRCAPFCVGPGPQPVTGAGLHYVIFPTPQWSFRATGSAQWTVSEKPTNGNAIDMLVTWNGAWRVTIALDAMVGSTIEETVLADLPPTNPPNEGTGTGGGVNATPLAAGSELPIFIGAGPNGLVLYHFGVIVAANSAAEQSFPTMTVASAHEAALAAQLAGHS